MMNSLKVLVLCVLASGCGPQPFYGIHFDDEPLFDVSVGGTPTSLGRAIAVDAGQNSAGGASSLDGATIPVGSGGAPGADTTREAGVDGAPVVAPDGAAPSHDAGKHDSASYADAGSACPDSAVGCHGGSDGCVLVTHDNGYGHHWIDCVPFGTHDELQAQKACETWCANVHCTEPCSYPILCNEPVVLGSISEPGGTVMLGWEWKNGGSMLVFSTDKSMCAVAGKWN
jgi:hypothetical protein